MTKAAWRLLTPLRTLPLFAYPQRMEKRKTAQAAIVEAMQKMQAGKISYIEGSRFVWGELEAAGIDQLSEPWIGFVSIASQSEAVPLGTYREIGHPTLWLAIWLAGTDARFMRKQAGAAACREGLTVFAHARSGQQATSDLS